MVRPARRSAVKKRDARRDGPVVAGEHADAATAVLQPRDDKLPEATGAASDKDGRGHGLFACSA